MIKIITGKYKGRVIPTQKKADYRPSTGKFREALFSILTSGAYREQGLLENSNVLDLFSGTGSLGFEALSRGAISATFIDNNEQFLKMAKEFAEKIEAQAETNFLKLSAINLPFSGRKYNLILMDPPYHKDYVRKAINSLIKSEWLEDGAIVATEISKTDDIKPIKNIIVVEERRYGNSKLIILKYEQS